MTLMLAFLMMAPVSVDAQRRSNNKKTNNKWAKNKLDLHQIHNVAMWGGVGYSGLVNSYKNDNASRFIGGGGGLIGVGY